MQEESLRKISSIKTMEPERKGSFIKPPNESERKVSSISIKPSESERKISSINPNESERRTPSERKLSTNKPAEDQVHIEHEIFLLFVRYK